MEKSEPHKTSPPILGEGPAAERFSRALRHHRNGEISRAEEIYREILAGDPQHFGALYMLGLLMLRANLGERALGLIDKALEVRPDRAEAHYARGLALKQLRRPEEALASYDEALAIKPDYLDALLDRAAALVALERRDEALASYDRALAINPDHAEALNSRGNVLAEMTRLDEAVASYDKALAIRPDYAEALNNRGNVLSELGRLEEALACYDKALAIRPNYAEAHANRGSVLLEMKRPDEALVCYDKALAIKPDYVEAGFNKGSCLLLLGRFDLGWLYYKNRMKTTGYLGHFSPRAFPRPMWSGAEDLAGKTLFIYWEQGLGDAIQFCRYAKLAEQRGAKVVFSVQNPIRALLRTLSPTIQIINETQAPVAFDCYAPLLNLPPAFQTVLESVPAEVPYLRAEAERVRKWRERIGDAGFKVGVAWQGRKGGKVDIGRSFALAEFLAVSRVPNVRLISLQKNEGVEQLRDLPEGMRVETLGEDYDAGDDAFLDAAAVMESLDLVISSDTAVAHLAGALARPVWVALKRTPDWRWMFDRSDCPWYPTMRLFRQQARGDWKGVFSQIESALRELTGAARSMEKEAAPSAPTPKVPVSWGELIDKITILEIKNVEIASETARENVRKELALLQEIAGAFAARADVADLKSSLKAVNVALWKTEDAIREKERRRAFDEAFVALARSVYRQNDERARIKRLINELFASEIVEEKSYESY